VAQRGQIGGHRVHLRGSLRVGDRGHRFRPAHPERDVAAGQQVRPGHRHRADPDGTEHRRVPRRYPRQHYEDRVALGDAQLEQRPGGAPRVGRELGRALARHHFTVAVESQQREGVGLLGRPPFHDVEHRVAPARDLEVEACPGVVVRRHAGRGVPPWPLLLVHL